jgi:hypothetical protein
MVEVVSVSTYEELSSILEISKQVTDMQETIDKMKAVAGTFNLDSVLVDNLRDGAAEIQDTLYQDSDTLRKIKKREKTFPLPTDVMTARSCENDILEKIRTYQQEFLPNYQKAVEKLLDKKDDIKSKVAEKRQAGEKVPDDTETKNALDEAGKQLQQAIKEKPEVQKTFSSIRSFIEKAKPYVGPLISAAKIALALIG